MNIEDIGRHDVYKESMPDLPLPIYYERIDMTRQTDKVRDEFEAWVSPFAYSYCEIESLRSAWQASRTAALNEAIEIIKDSNGMTVYAERMIERLRDGK